MYSTLIIKNKSVLKRFSHGKRFETAIELLDVKAGDRIADYGTGDGYILRLLLCQESQCEIFGYEPVPSMYKELTSALAQEVAERKVTISAGLSGMPKGYFDKICCLEVLEHLPEQDQCVALESMKELLHDKGVIVISVPIEIGFSSLAKNIARIILRQTHQGTTFKAIIWSLFGVRIERENSRYMSSHIGFNYKDLENLIILQGLVIKTKSFSPIRILGGILNSQIFYVLHK